MRVRSYDEAGDCSYCEENRDHIAPFHEIAEFIGERMGTFYGLAGNQLPYESREGGFQGRHEDTHDCLYDSIGLEITSEREELLRQDLVDEIGDETWCDYDWLALELDQSLLFSWEQFCSTVKGHRRFFFHRVGETEESHPDERSAFQFLHELAELIENRGLIRELPTGTAFYRARPNENGVPWAHAVDLGPPPVGAALQSNRMNPPGIPMFYGASTAALAIEEVRSTDVTVGTFSPTTPVRVVDLAHLPDVPGFFSESSRERIQTIAFLHDLTRAMAAPVAQNNRVNVDYIPTQIVTEFLRDFPFVGGTVDGIQYVTATNSQGYNTVLFATQENVADPRNISSSIRQWLILNEVEAVAAST
ncbi:MAG: HEPN-associated N-terminal domain-containing protein [Paracoccaceae bacterium]